MNKSLHQSARQSVVYHNRPHLQNISRMVTQNLNLVLRSINLDIDDTPSHIQTSRSTDERSKTIHTDREDYHKTNPMDRRFRAPGEIFLLEVRGL
jgi:hypothetical protein